jgi:glycosyltransferase involved in cell wall biosynthesis
VDAARFAIVASHPVQYQAPWFRALAREASIEVLFCHRQDAAGQAAAGFGQPFEWDVPLADGYPHRWLHNAARSPSVDHFFGCNTPGIGEALQAGRFEACIVCGWYLKSYLQAISACRRQGIPVLVRGDSQLAGPRSLAKNAVKYWPYRWLLGRIDGHLYVGSANRRYLEHYGVPARRLFFVPHFVDTAWFRAEADRARADGRVAALRSELGIGADAAVALFAGKLIEKKRPGDFVAALARLSDEGMSIRGVVVGSGPLEHALRATALETHAPVAFAGFRNQSGMPACYALADVLVLPSDGRETWGLVANEALSCGVPVVLSADVGAAADLADDRLAGFTYPGGDVQALARAIARAIAVGRTRPDEVSRAIREKMEAFSLAHAVAGTLDAVRSVRATRGSPARVASAQERT